MDILTTNVELLTVNGTGSMDGAVRYDVAQSLSEEQKIQAQDNIGANTKYGTLTQINALNSALYDVNVRYNQVAAAELTDAANIETNTKDIEDLKNAAKNYGTRVYNTGRGGYNSYERMTLTDQYDNLGNGKSISITRESEWGQSTVECGYTVSEDGRYNAETAANNVLRGIAGYSTSSNYNKIWYMPVSNVSNKGIIDGDITFTISEPNLSVSFMLIKCDGNFDTANWNPDKDVWSICQYVVGHPITIPFHVKNTTMYAIGIKGSSAHDTTPAASSANVSVNFFNVRYHDTTL